MNNIFKQGGPIDELRISLIENVVARLARRAGKHIVGMITPYPISNAVFDENVKGPILCYMFPCEGVITKGLVYIGPAVKNGAMLVVQVVNATGNIYKDFTVKDGFLLVATEIKVSAGSRLSISISTIDPAEAIKEVWVSFLWAPTIKDIDAKSFIIEELDADARLIAEGG